MNCKDTAYLYLPAPAVGGSLALVKTGDTVQRINEQQFYYLSTQMYPLRNLENARLTQDTLFQLHFARDALFALLDRIPLRVCQPATRNVIAQIDNIIPRDLSEGVNLIADPKTAPFIYAYTLKKAVEEFEIVLAAELQALDTYLVSQKGAYSTPDLIERAEILLPESIRKDLPLQAINDIREAGRCIAFDVPTAAGFHILRAAESVIVEYYVVLIGTKPPTRLRNWKIYIDKMRKSGKANIKILEFLDHIRSQYRNPVSHPEVNLSLDEAEILLGTAISAIRFMIIEIQKSKAALPVAPPQPALPITPLPPIPALPQP